MCDISKQLDIKYYAVDPKYTIIQSKFRLTYAMLNIN